MQSTYKFITALKVSPPIDIFKIGNVKSEYINEFE